MAGWPIRGDERGAVILATAYECELACGRNNGQVGGKMKNE